MKKIAGAIAFASTLMISSAAFAACTTETKKDDLTDAEVQAIYDCLKSDLRAGYTAKGEARTQEYQSWKNASTLPAVNGAHGKRFLMTFVNETGFEEYTKFADEGVKMPVGSVVAKESFNVSKKGKVKSGPLFFMEKVAAGTADEFGNWLYSAYTPKGKVMKVKQGFCQGCHKAFEDQDALGYPGEDYRVSSN